MKHSKKILAGILACSMVMGGALAGCNNNNNEPEEPCTNHVDVNPKDNKCDNCGADMPAPAVVKDTDGRWSYYEEGVQSNLVLKLKEDGTFYYVPLFDDYALAGTWEIKAQSKKYYKIESGNTPDASKGDDTTEYTADKTIILKSYDGAVLEGAYADGKIYQLPMWMGGASQGGRTLTHEPTYNYKEEDEKAIEVVKVCLNKNANKSLILLHNGTLTDNINSNITGTWAQTSTGFDLKNSEGTKYASVTKVAEGECTYTPVSGTATTLYTEAWTPVYELDNHAEDGENVYTLKLWEDGSADLVKLDATTGADSTPASGTWTEEDGNVKTVVLGEKEVTVTDEDGLLTVTVKLSDTETVEVSIRLADVYAGEASELQAGLPLGTVEGGTNLLAKKDGNFDLLVGITMQGSPAGNLKISGTFNAKNMEFSYSQQESAEAEPKSAVAKPEIDANGKVTLTFEKLYMTSSANAAAKFTVGKVVVTLGDSWNWIALNDYTTTNKTETYSSMGPVNGMIKDAYLFMKDGKFEVAFNYGQVASAIKGTYAESNGNVVFTVPGETETTFTSANGIVEMNGTVNIGMEVALSFKFQIENKTKADVNGETPYQTAGTDKATIDKAYITLNDGEFTITFDATAVMMGGNKVPGNLLFKGTYNDNGADGYTFIMGEGKTPVVKTDGKYTFVFENYSFMGQFSFGNVTVIFDLG